MQQPRSHRASSDASRTTAATTAVTIAAPAAAICEMGGSSEHLCFEADVSEASCMRLCRLHVKNGFKCNLVAFDLVFLILVAL